MPYGATTDVSKRRSCISLTTRAGRDGDQEKARSRSANTSGNDRSQLDNDPDVPYLGIGGEGAQAAVRHRACDLECGGKEFPRGRQTARREAYGRARSATSARPYTLVRNSVEGNGGASPSVHRRPKNPSHMPRCGGQRTLIPEGHARQLLTSVSFIRFSSPPPSGAPSREPQNKPQAKGAALREQP
jgi:hypothetical protein